MEESYADYRDINIICSDSDFSQTTPDHVSNMKHQPVIISTIYWIGIAGGH